MKSPNIIVELSFDFAIQIIQVCRKLVEKREFVISNQLLRSATSIGANVEEATAAQSKKDFIAKMCIASKEARETSYWLRLLAATKIADLDYKNLIQKIEVIIKILTSIVKTSQERLRM
jgi:four helix bundle protein